LAKQRTRPRRRRQGARKDGQQPWGRVVTMYRSTATRHSDRSESCIFRPAITSASSPGSR
jgi:hypothetical protein